MVEAGETARLKRRSVALLEPSSPVEAFLSPVASRASSAQKLRRESTAVSSWRGLKVSFGRREASP